MTYFGRISASASLLALVISAPASAAVLIEGTGLWGAGTATTPYSKLNKSFQFSFTVPNPLDANPTSAFADFSYSLGGVGVAAVPSSIKFYTVGNNGMFDFYFTGYIVSIYGADIGSTGFFTTPNAYSVTVAMNQGGATGLGFVTVTDAPPVPEPATWAMMVGGFGLIGGVMRRRANTVSYAI